MRLTQPVPAWASDYQVRRCKVGHGGGPTSRLEVVRMRRLGPGRRFVVVVVVLLLSAASCAGSHGSPQQAAPDSTGQTGSTVGKRSAPYLLLRGAEWKLTGAATAKTMPGGLPFGGLWTLSYEKRTSPSSTVGAALFLGDPDASARELADQISGGNAGTVTTTEVGSTPAVAVEELSPKTHELTAVHVLWDLGTHIAWVTVYDGVSRDAAVDIARQVSEVSRSDWETATGQKLPN
jgi:hypothetical protein